MSIATLRRAVDTTVTVDPDTLGDAALADELLALRAEMDRLDAQFARVARAAHRRGIGAADGSPSTAAWLRRRSHLREGDARAAIEAGDAAELLPATAAAWRAGEITTGAARTLFGARVEGHDLELVALEPVLLDLARDGALRELRKACAHFRNLATADGASPRERDGLTISATYDGRTLVHGDLSSDAAEKVLTALHALTDPPTDGDARTPARRRADALVRMAELALGALEAGTGRTRPACTIVIDWATLVGSQPGRVDGDFTGSLHPRDIDRLLCDATISRVVTGPDSLPLDAGRAHRHPNPGQRRSLAVRDGGCRFPHCGRPPGWTEAHHVVRWVDGGRTDLHAMVLLCDHHHHLVHQPGWIVKFDGHTLRIIRPDGIEVR